MYSHVARQVSDALLELAEALSASLQGRDEARSVAHETTSRLVTLAQAEGQRGLLALAQPFAAQLQDAQVRKSRKAMHAAVCILVVHTCAYWYTRLHRHRRSQPRCRAPMRRSSLTRTRRSGSRTFCC